MCIRDSGKPLEDRPLVLGLAVAALLPAQDLVVPEIPWIDGGHRIAFAMPGPPFEATEP